MEWWRQHARGGPECGEARQVQHRLELHAVCRRRVLRFRSRQEEGQHRIELSRAGVIPAQTRFAFVAPTQTRFALVVPAQTRFAFVASKRVVLSRPRKRVLCFVANGISSRWKSKTGRR